jgi:putative mRNA 3-end processing factor
MSRIALKSDGAILLGETVCCDGFAWRRPVRVQTHIHADHMVDFDTSKANQTIVMSEETKALLNALFNADLPFRTNIRTISSGVSFAVDDETIELFPSHHMLGSVQVRVTCADGYRVGYSSDFYWPLQNAIQVDALIVDATYGDPLRTRKFDQQLADDCLIGAAVTNLKRNIPTVCVAHNGRLQYAMHLLGSLIPWPIICSPRAFPLIEVYRQHGYAMPPVLKSTSAEALTLLRGKDPCFAFATLPEQRHLPWVDQMRKIQLSAYISSPSHPLTKYDNGDYCVSLTDHADFMGTMEYIRATGATVVYADPRSGNAQALVEAVQTRLRVPSMIVPELKSREWG